MIKQLYPKNCENIALKGVYLGLNLHQQAKMGDIFIYANYITSLDGRIALYNAEMNEYEVPTEIANGRDWRLYQELAGQADVILTSARYFRQLAKGKAQDLLPVGAGKSYADIKTWRARQGLQAQPDVMILSNSLDIPHVALRQIKDRKVMVCTASHDVEKIKTLKQEGVQILQVDDVTGTSVRSLLIQKGYRSAYLIAGPQVHATMVEDDCVDELFLTMHFTLLGGKKISGVLDTDMTKAQALVLKSMYLDDQEYQLFQRFGYKHV